MSDAGSVNLEGIVKRHGAVTVLHGVDLAIAPGEFFALLGPSGSGKTTTLRILAGLEPHDAGRVIMEGVDVTQRQPGERDVAMVFQSYALYPHMTVYENIAFPLRMVATPGAEIDATVREAAAKVRIDHLLERRPGQLSGGQQQRCALARAIVRKPRLFLLDEPLSNLDARLRAETRVELRKLQRALGVTTVYVTHDQEEAMTMADRIAVFMEGRIAQVGTPHDIFERPASTSVAAFIGSPPMNLLPAEVRDGKLTVAGAEFAFARPLGADGLVTAGLRPGALEIAARGIPGRVYLVEDLGESSIVDVQVEQHLVKVRMQHRPELREGDTVHLGFEESALHLFDRASGLRRSWRVRTRAGTRMPAPASNGQVGANSWGRAGCRRCEFIRTRRSNHPAAE